MKRVAWIYHPEYLLHAPPFEHPESPERLVAITDHLEGVGLTERMVAVTPDYPEDADILSVHDREYLNRLETACRRGDLTLDAEDTYLNRHSFNIALLSAGGAIAGAKAVAEGTVDSAFCAVRPPGHHAGRDVGMGFCLLNNVAVAARYLQARHGVERVLIIDWDVHHGNGTQKAFYRDPGVLTISIHQDRWYPHDSGGMDERGEGPGFGFNINIPLPPGSGHGAYLATIERVVVPALHAFRPELIVVPSGFDGSMWDPLGRMMAYSETYRAMTRMLMAAADELCGGRLVLSHEGGYAPLYVPFCGLAVMEELSGVKTPVDDPMAARAGAVGGQDLQPHQDEVIRRAERLTCP